ncbi:TPA: structural protein [Streptococcus pneumoniae]|nr:structural protein [Streptococcus pneumoniae]
MTKFINSSGPLHLNLYVEQVSQDITNNSSKVRWRATIDRDGAYRTWTYGNISNLSVWLNGASVHSSHPDYDTSGEEVSLASGEVTIPHESDGTKTFSVWASFDPNNGVHGNITISTKYTLSSLPRSSAVAGLDGDRNLGSRHTIRIDRKASSFTHQVWYRVFGSDWIDLGKNHTTSVSFTPSLDLARYLPKSSSGVMDICVRTYNGTTQIGSDVYSNGWYFKIPDSVKPTFTDLSLTDMNTVARRLLGGNDFLQIISDIQVNFNNASGAYGSTITGYRAEIVNKKNSVSENGGRLGMMNFNGSATIRAYVTDSRGRRSDTKDITINIIEYFAPSFSFSALRTRGNPNTLQVLRNARIAPIMQLGKQRNVMSLTFKVAQIGNENFTDDNGSASGNFTSVHTLTNSAANMAGNYPSNKSFVIIGKLEDKFTSVEFSTTVATESVVMSYDKNGRVGIGKVAEFGKPGSVDVLGDIYSNSKPIQQYQLTDGNGCGKLIKQDFNSMKDTGFWWIDGTSPNNPFGAWGMLEVFRPNPNSQECIQRFTTSFGYMAVRENGFDNNWRPWRYLVQQSKSTNNSDYVALSKTESNPTPWQNANLQNGWSHHRDYGNVQFSKTFDGIVYLKGTCKGGNTTRESIIFTLPENFRPSTTLFKTALNNDYGSAVIGIYPSGNVVVKGNVDATWLNFDNVSFKI